MSVFIVALAGLIMVALCGAYVWYTRRHLRGDTPTALAALSDAVRDIDLFGDSKPSLEIETDGATGEVADSINHLLEGIDRYKNRLVARDQRVRRLMGNIADTLYQADSNLRLAWVSSPVIHVLGYSSEEIRGRYIDELLVEPENGESVFLGRSWVSNYPLRFYRRDGSVAWVLVTARRLQDANGHFIGTEGSFRDGTKLVEAEQALFSERERAQTTLASIGDSVITTTTAGVVDYMNRSAEKLTGEADASAKGRYFNDICRLSDSRSGEPFVHLIRDCVQAENGARLHTEATLYHRRRRCELTVRVSVSPIYDKGNGVSGIVVVLHDITELRKISRQMAHQATHDSLTGLPNRQAFEEFLRDVLAHAGLGVCENVLCYLDVDQFKIVNDTCGHAAGDELLRQVATLLASQIRENDFVARLGGDEFGIVLCDTTTEQAASTAERMRKCVEDIRFHWDNKLLHVSISIGLLPLGYDAGKFPNVLSNADGACYVAKDMGRNRVHTHLPGGDAVAHRHGEMERLQRLHEAIQRKDFLIYSQVIRAVDWRPGDTFALEFLVRIRNGDDSVLEPATFLPTAERFQLVTQIDRWVFERALELIGHYPHPACDVTQYSINLSAQSVTDAEFAEFALDLLRRSNVDPNRLVFELTETSAVTNFTRATHFIENFRELGCHFALDDFGSGLSSFSYLKNLPVDFIKIDGSFVRNILSDPVDLETVKGINQVGHAMGLKTIAEYVESAEILEKLRGIGVDYAQGYHIGAPMPHEETCATIWNWNRLRFTGASGA